jgi:signal transduction histidine kinase
MLQVSTEPLVNAILDAIADVEPLAARKNLTILNRVTAESATMLMDRSKFAQALSNLLQNAIHHSPPGESILISAQRRQSAGQTWVMCTIEDRGGGFAEADLTRAFEPFFTNRKGGTGLGLSIVQRIVQHHGGWVVAENRSGGGACLTIMIPHLADGEKR